MTLHAFGANSCRYYVADFDHLSLFFQGDLETKFLNSEFVKIPGKDPELIFYNKNDEELERIDIKDWLRSELVELLDEKGIERQPFHPKPDPATVDSNVEENKDAIQQDDATEAKKELQ